MSKQVDFSSWGCPLPLRDHPRIVLGHGGGGQLTAELVEHLFLPAFDNPALASLGDSAVVPSPGERLAFSSDGFVVDPLIFPGGSIGELAIHGTVNDLAMAGAVPRFLSASFILEEGLELAMLGEIVRRMGEAARDAGVQVVTGDTKVVERGHGHGCFITTAGFGAVPAGVDVGPHRIRPGDAVLLSGTVADHGMAVMSVREGLELGSTIRSDTAALYPLVEALLAAGEVHALRDPTRGGVAAVLDEMAGSARVGIEIDDEVLPLRPEVGAACELLGIDPLYVANEGKLVAIVPDDGADRALAALRAHPLGRQAIRLGRVTDQHPGKLVARTALGGRRIVPRQLGEPLPRIC